jgi:acetyltransferase-like isoleucine patch superfamily enzyme
MAVGPEERLMEDEAFQAWLHEARQVYDRLRQDMRQRFARDLPLEELLFDRWERARSLGFGERASIYHNSYVYGDVRVGANTWIGPHTLLDGSGGLTIGSHCNISAGVQIYTHDTVRRTLSAGKLGIDRVPVSIGDCCYIGSNSVIAKGVTIGHHCVVGACSFVNRDVPAFSVAAGIPCRTVGEVVVEGDEVRIVYPRVS